MVFCQAGENTTTWKEILVCSLQDPFLYMKIVSSWLHIIFHISNRCHFSVTFLILPLYLWMHVYVHALEAFSCEMNLCYCLALVKFPSCLITFWLLCIMTFGSIFTDCLLPSSCLSCCELLWDCSMWKRRKCQYFFFSSFELSVLFHILRDI